MLVLTKSLFALMIGFIISTIFGVVFIPILKRIKAGQRINVYVDAHKSKAGTPTMGGFIFIIPCIITVILLLLTNKMQYSINLFIILFVLISYAMIGFLDDYISLKHHENKGLTQVQKLLLQFVVALVFYVLFRHFGDGDSVLRVTLFNLEWNLNWFYGVFILFLLIGSSNAVNLTDGLDGLAGGLSAIAFLAFGLIAWGSLGIAGNEDIGVFCFILVGSLVAFLFYNTYPAKVFMGDTGSLALGGALAAVSIVSSHELTLVIVAGVFVIETLTCIIQRVSVRFTGKRIFLMTPLHHHFEKLGWDERDIVKLFWAVGIVLSAVAIIFGVWI